MLQSTRKAHYTQHRIAGQTTPPKDRRLHTIRVAFVLAIGPIAIAESLAFAKSCAEVPDLSNSPSMPNSGVLPRPGAKLYIEPWAVRWKKVDHPPSRRIEA